ncbi:MAG: Na+/H+ antiporter subunit D [Gammaproteobacteria bacterium]|nr:Na+/H+ antiporter subunit D [Gammaproteobacteria bacterium]MCP4473967.1 Na+/H+ antiporter subunit D [Gammaproteobacteria bacterium]
MIAWLAMLPLFIALTTAIVTLGFTRSVRYQQAVTLVGTTALLIAAVALLVAVLKHQMIVVYLGNWSAPYGITVVVDLFSALMVLLTAVVGWIVVIYSCGELSIRQIRGGFYPAYALLLMGLCGAFITGDLFNLYVWFEVTLLASFVLVVCGGKKIQLDGAVKYVVLNLLATMLLLVAIALLYGMTGTLNLADMATKLYRFNATGLVTAVVVLLLAAFAIKAALFPLFFWLPAAYHTPPFSVSAIFAGLLSKLGLYSIIRIATLFVIANNALLHNLLLVVALLTLVIAIFAAIAQRQIRRILSFTLISHIGYMVVGLALATPLALAGSLFYLLQHVIVKTNLFLVSGVMKRLSGSEQLEVISDLYHTHPYIVLPFLLPALALAGFPPFSGFWAKLVLLQAAFRSHAYYSVAIMLLVSLLTLFVMLRIWLLAFWRQRHDKSDVTRVLSEKERGWLLLPLVIVTLLVVAISLLPAPCFALAHKASIQLLHRDQYIQAVLARRGV